MSSSRATTPAPAAAEPLSRDEAGRLTRRIEHRLAELASSYEQVLPLIREAISRDAHLALGYRSVGEYVADRFADSLTRLGVEVRREVVRELTAAGMSTRAIAPVVGASREAVRRDVAALAGDNTVSPDSTPQGEARPTSTAETTEAQAAPAPRPAVTGIDGKTYTRRPTPKPAGPTTAGPTATPAPPPPADPIAGPLKAASRAVADLAAAADGVRGVADRHRQAVRRASDELLEVAEALDPSTPANPEDLAAAVADIAARLDVDDQAAAAVAHLVQRRHHPGSLANYVRRIGAEDLRTRYTPERAKPRPADACAHSRPGGRRVVGRGPNASRVCDRCEAEAPAYGGDHP